MPAGNLTHGAVDPAPKDPVAAERRTLPAEQPLRLLWLRHGVDVEGDIELFRCNFTALNKAEILH